jgi:hypothetical protein
MKEKNEQIVEILEKIEGKDFGFYFFTLDTKGNPVASVATIYDHVKALTELGYNAYILHEKNDYHGVGEWLGKDFAKLKHVSIEKQELNLTTLDYIIVPEIFANVMEQVKDFPCKKIVLSQSYKYILELLTIGKRWDLDYGFTDVITTSERQAEYVKTLFYGLNTYIVPPSIPEYFKPTDKLKKPVISIVTRKQSDAVNIVKSFYLQYPMYKWITFRELRGLPRKNFAEELGNSCLAVWLDDDSGFGTFPLEAIQSSTPVIGKIPVMIPEWMESTSENGEISVINNGVWTNNELAIPTLIAQFMEVWLEDGVPKELIEGIEDSKNQYTTDIQKEKIKEVYELLILNRRNEFEALLEKETKIEA